MNFIDTMASVELVLAANQVPLLVGETGIGKTSLAARVADVHDWELVTIDGNLLKEGEIGGLPTVETVTHTDGHGRTREVKTTVYAVHHTLEHVAQAVDKGRQVLLFIDEINRAEHAVQQELMNLILNREINGFSLSDQVRIIAAMNPEDSFDYQTIDMDPAQQNRFVWLYMNADYMQWIDWAIGAGIEEKVIEFISSYPEYLNQRHEDDIDATPRSFERVSGLYTIYKNQEGSAYSRDVFMNVIRGNVGKLIAEAFVSFIESDQEPLITFDDVLGAVQKPGAIMSMAEQVKGESGGLPTVETVMHTDGHGRTREVKTTVYAVHHTLEHVAQAVDKGRQVLLFIDEINRAEHAVQQELMNLILNREINGFSLSNQVRIIAAMNPEDSFDYQTIDMDPAQQNRFVWLYMNADYMQWIDWAIGAGIEEKVIEFISSYPEYLNQRHEDDIDATPRSFERVSGLYTIYKNQEGSAYSRDVFMNVIRGNVGKLIAEAFVSFIESDQEPLITFDDVLTAVQKPGAIMSMAEQVKGESPTRLYVAAKNMLHRLNRNSNAEEIHHFVEFLTLYSGDLRVAVMKDLRNTYERVYTYAIEDDLFVDTFFEAQK